MLLSVRLPELTLRVLAHLSGDDDLRRAAQVQPPHRFVAAASEHWVAVRAEAGDMLCEAHSGRDAVSAVRSLWDGVLGGLLLPEGHIDVDDEPNAMGADSMEVDSRPRHPPQPRQRTRVRSAAGGSSGAPREPQWTGTSRLSSLLSSFPGVRRYHSRLLGAARSGQGRVPTVGGRMITASSMLFSSCVREREAAEVEPREESNTCATPSLQPPHTLQAAALCPWKAPARARALSLSWPLLPPHARSIRRRAGCFARRGVPRVGR